MDRQTVERFRQTFEQVVLELVDERGNLAYLKRYTSFNRPAAMPVNIVVQHKAGAFAGLLAQDDATQEQALRDRARELVDELIGARRKRCFLLEERPVEFWQEGNHLHYCWRIGCAEEGEEQTEQQWLHDAGASAGTSTTAGKTRH